MYDFNLQFLSGGYHCCSSVWNSDPLGNDNCYKLYFVVEGEARIQMDGVWYDITEGNVYYLNGFKLQKQRCDAVMKVYWLHFLPESLLVNMYLNDFDPIYAWGQGTIIPDQVDFKNIPRLFDRPYVKVNRMVRAPLMLASHLHTMVWFLMNDMFEKQNMEAYDHFYDMYQRMKPAIDYIDNHYHENLTLNDISQKIYLNPAYFVRLFKKHFRITPFRYITMKRLNQASRLLLNTDMSIQQISERTGYCNQFYFSKVFREQFHIAPSVYRHTQPSP